MFIPEIFYGKYSDVEKRFKSIRGRRKTLENIIELYEKINDGVDDKIYHDDFVIGLADDYLGKKLQNAYYPFVFTNYVTFDEAWNSEFHSLLKELSLKSKWCQLAVLATNTSCQYLFDDKSYSKALGDSICENWDFYKSFGEVYCFMAIRQKINDRYFFWEYNIELVKIFFSLTGRKDLTDDDLKNFPMLWKKYCC